MSYFDTRDHELEVNAKTSTAPFPINALVELSNGCNHKCLFCYNTLMERKVGKLDKDLFKQFVADAVKHGLLELGLYTTGEPFILSNLSEYIAIAKEEGVNRIYLTTNGSLASVDNVERCIQSGLSSLKFSINAIDKDTYKLIHGRDDWDVVVENLIDIYNLVTSKYPHVRLFGSCIMTNLTGDISDEFASRFGQYFDDMYINYAGQQGGRNAKYVERFSEYVIHASLSDTKPCEMLWNRLHLTCEGYLTCCCVDYEHDLIYADFKRDSLLDAWNNDLMQSIRRRHIEKELVGTICYNCLTGEKTKYSPISNISDQSIKSSTPSSKLDTYLNRIKNIENN